MLLPEPLGPITATSSPASTVRSTSWRAWTSDGAFAIDLRHAAELDHRGHAHTVDFRAMPRRRLSGSRLRQRPPLQSRISGVEPAHHGVEAKQLGIGDQRQLDIIVGGLGLDVRAVLHRLHEVAPVDLQHLVQVHAGQAQADQHLDDQLVAGRELGVRRRVQPTRQLPAAVRGDAVALPRPVAIRLVRFDEPIALEPLQRRVHLADVQRPHLPGADLELLTQPEAVLRTLAQQGQQGMGDAHEALTGRDIPRSIRSITFLASGICAVLAPHGCRLAPGAPRADSPDGPGPAISVPPIPKSEPRGAWSGERAALARRWSRRNDRRCPSGDF